MKRSMCLGNGPQLAKWQCLQRPLTPVEQRRSCLALIRQIRRMMGWEPRNVYLSIQCQTGAHTSIPVVIVEYDLSDSIGHQYAVRTRSILLCDWDSAAKGEINSLLAA